MINISINKPMAKLTMTVMLMISSHNLWACDKPTTTHSYDRIYCITDGVAKVKKF